MFVIARTMPQRTMEGARMYAQLAAYRRTLQKTLEQSRTMDQVVSSKVLPWVETPDQAMVWAYALGLHEEAEEVLERSMEDVRTGGCLAHAHLLPALVQPGCARGRAHQRRHRRAPTAGLFSERRGARLHGHDRGALAASAARRPRRAVVAASVAAAPVAVVGVPAAASRSRRRPRSALAAARIHIDGAGRLVCSHGCD